ncbi:MAG: hypothetical protein AAF998_14300 [Bacteroidota bacterium]
MAVNDSTAFIAMQDDGVWHMQASRHRNWELEDYARGFSGTTKLHWDSVGDQLYMVSRKFFRREAGRVRPLNARRISRGAKDIAHRPEGQFWVCGRSGLFRVDLAVPERLDSVIIGQEFLFYP